MVFAEGVLNEPFIKERLKKQFVLERPLKKQFV